MFLRWWLVLISRTLALREEDSLFVVGGLPVGTVLDEDKSKGPEKRWRGGVFLEREFCRKHERSCEKTRKSWLRGLNISYIEALLKTISVSQESECWKIELRMAANLKSLNVMVLVV